MKHILSTCWLLCLGFSILAQAPQLSLGGQITQAHKPIAHTDILLVPPPGFEQAANFTGYQQRASGASIHLAELGGGVAANLASFSSESLMGRGMFVRSEESIRYGLHTGRFIEVEQYSHGTKVIKYILVFGDDSRTFLITSNFPKDVSAIAPMIRESMFTAAVSAP